MARRATRSRFSGLRSAISTPTVRAIARSAARNWHCCPPCVQSGQDRRVDGTRRSSRRPPGRPRRLTAGGRGRIRPLRHRSPARLSSPASIPSSFNRPGAPSRRLRRTRPTRQPCRITSTNRSTPSWQPARPSEPPPEPSSTGARPRVPVARALTAWLDSAPAALDAQRQVADLKDAEAWLKATSGEIRAERSGVDANSGHRALAPVSAAEQRRPGERRPHRHRDFAPGEDRCHDRWRAERGARRDEPGRAPRDGPEPVPPARDPAGEPIPAPWSSTIPSNRWIPRASTASPACSRTSRGIARSSSSRTTTGCPNRRAGCASTPG